MISRYWTKFCLYSICLLVIVTLSKINLAGAQNTDNPVANREVQSPPPAMLTTTVGQDVTLSSDVPKPITMDVQKESFEQRLQRKITLDIRDMNMVDVIKFLAVKGDFNVVASPSVTGRVTLLLKSVSIKDALDIVVISNQLAYQIQNEIIQIMSEAEFGALFGKKFSDQTEVSIVRLNYAKPSYVLSALDSIKSNLGKIIIDEDTGSVVLIDTPQAIAEMKKAIESAKREFAEVRTGRAHPGLIEGMHIDYFGTPTLLKQMAAISVPDPKTVLIQPWDVSAIPEIEKAISISNLGASASNDGKIGRLIIPPLSKERREEMKKVVKDMSEKSRVSLRTIRRDANETIKKLQSEKKITEDDNFKSQEAIQKLTDKFIKEIDLLLEEKSKALVEM